eukprot:TRINITY_DN3693_c0_g1_i11.p1 TRINITY_DN3693_c0_g1~~TRINITY_DN3693_c0_g1_i11.p1  ORF type:complete len:154 (+),score=32.25 TRINITY_DN3693_c0_g1_i11:619-1080(+)
MIGGFKEILRNEGLKGLWRGAEAQMLRVGVGSSVQLSTYDLVSHFVSSFSLVQKYPDLSPFLSAFATSIPLSIAMNPVDCVATRLYNQNVIDGKGALYKGPFHCLKRTFQEEGLRGLFKGTFANYVRLGPHTICTFVFWEKTKQMVNKLDDFV